MKQEERYRRALKRLKAFEPALDNRQEMTDRVMRSVREEIHASGPIELVLQFLFSWVTTPWLRISMAVITIGFITAFSLQQMKMTQRINQLENQLTIAVEEMPEYVAGPSISERVLMNMLDREQQNDSVTVSTKDLQELINSFMLFIEDPAYKKRFNRAIRPFEKNSRSSNSRGSEKHGTTKTL